MTGTEAIPEMLVYMLLKHFKWLLVQESFTHVRLWASTYMGPFFYWHLCTEVLCARLIL